MRYEDLERLVDSDGKFYSTEVLKRLLNEGEITDSSNLEVIEIDEGSRRVKLSFASPKIARRWWGKEKLDVNSDAMNTQRVAKGKCNFLLNHDRNQFLGRVLSVWFEKSTGGDKAYAEIEFDEDAESDKWFQRVVKKLITSVSFGYRYLEDGIKLDEIDEDSGDDTYRVVSYELLEISLETVPEDDDVGTTRSLYSANAKFIEQVRSLVSDENDTEASELITDPISNLPKIIQKRREDKEQEKMAKNNEATKAERSRIMKIQKFARTLKIDDDDFVEGLIEKDLKADEAYEKMIEKRQSWEAENLPSNINPSSDAELGEGENEKVLSGLRSAVFTRSSNGKYTEENQDYRFYRLPDVCRKIMEMKGDRSFRPPHETVSRAMLTTEFQNLMSNLAKKTLQKSYDTQPQPWRSFVSEQRQLSDYKEIASIKLSNSPDMAVKAENADYKIVRLQDGGEKWSLVKQGFILEMSEELIVNDDLNALSKVPKMAGISAARAESRLVNNALFSQNMNDGKPLFDASRNNIGTAAPIGDDALREAKLYFRLQRGLKSLNNDKTEQDNEPLNLTPKFIYTPATLEDEVIKRFIVKTQAMRTEDVNAYYGMLEPLVDAWLDGASTESYYFVGDPAVMDVLEIGYMMGSEGVQIAEEVNFDNDALRIKAKHVFGAKPIDPNAFFKNPGAPRENSIGAPES